MAEQELPKEVHLFHLLGVSLAEDFHFTPPTRSYLCACGSVDNIIRLLGTHFHLEFPIWGCSRYVDFRHIPINM